MKFQTDKEQIDELCGMVTKLRIENMNARGELQRLLAVVHERDEAWAEVERLRAALREWYAAQVESMGPDEAQWAPHHGELAEMLPQHDRADLRGGDDDR